MYASHLHDGSVVAGDGARYVGAPWPAGASKEEQVAWVKGFLAAERSEWDVESVTPVASGFLSAAFFVNLRDGVRFVLIRSSVPKHRAWECQVAVDAEQPGIVCELVLKQYDAERLGSVELVPTCDGGEVQTFPVFMGFPGEVPPPDLCEKVGSALARLHKVGTAWHHNFASVAAYEAAGYPAVPSDAEQVPHLIRDGVPEPGLHSIVQYQLNLLRMVLPEELESVGADAAFCEAEVRKWTEHPVLPTGSSWLTRTVTGHGDLHGSNLLTHKGEPIFIDLETAHVGPAGWDVGHFYQCLRRYHAEHDYAQVSAFARGYIREASAAEPSEEAIDEFLFDAICWWYFANMKQALCLFLVVRLCGMPRSPLARWDFAMKTVGVAYLQRFVAKIAEARAGGAQARREFARKGDLDF